MTQTVERPIGGPASESTRELLARRRSEAQDAWARQEAVVIGMREGLDTGPGDEVDHATSRVQLDEQLILVDGLRRHLDELTVAVQREAAGTYGRCERCEQSIPEERLLLFPAATHCVACKQAVERR